jgi:hypothetical protein
MFVCWSLYFLAFELWFEDPLRDRQRRRSVRVGSRVQSYGSLEKGSLEKPNRPEYEIVAVEGSMDRSDSAASLLEAPYKPATAYMSGLETVMHWLYNCLTPAPLQSRGTGRGTKQSWTEHMSNEV